MYNELGMAREPFSLSMMTSCILAATLAAGCSHCHGRTTPTQEDELESAGLQPLRGFLKSLDLVSSDESRSILIDHGHDPHIPVLAPLGEVLQHITPRRFGYDLKVKHDGKSLYLEWFLCCVEIESSGQVVKESLASLMEDHGFSAEASRKGFVGKQEYPFTKMINGNQHQIRIVEPDDLAGSERAGCETTLFYTIKPSKPVPAPRVLDMVRVFPEIACPELPDEILDYIGDMEFSEMSLGGTSHKHSEWSVTLPCRDEATARWKLKKIRRIISALGYKWDGTDSMVLEVHERKEGQRQSSIYLQEGSDWIRLRFLPHI